MSRVHMQTAISRIFYEEICKEFLLISLTALKKAVFSLLIRKTIIEKKHYYGQSKKQKKNKKN